MSYTRINIVIVIREIDCVIHHQINVYTYLVSKNDVHIYREYLLYMSIEVGPFLFIFACMFIMYTSL